MTSTIVSYRISSRTSGAVLGVYQGATADDAIAAMHRDAGYASSEAAADALGTTTDALRADLAAVPATVYRIAPSTTRDFDLAGPGNKFATYEDALAAAEAMDVTCPVEGDDEWHVWEVSPSGAATCVTL